MKALVVRELRRLVPYGLGATALCGGAVALTHPTQSPAGALATLGAGALLGVAAVAPDTASGSTQFLRTLPLPTWRVGAAKAFVAGAWALAATLPEAAATGTLEVLLPAFGFSAGLLASVIAPRALVATVLAPLIVVITLLLGLALPAAALTLQPPPGQVVLSVTSAATIALAVLAYARGDRHRPTARPAWIAAGGLAPLFVLVFAATAGARAYTFTRVLPGALHVRGTTALPASRGLAVELEAHLWTGPEWRVAVLEADRAWLVPARGALDPRPSPDGRFLLLQSGWQPGGWQVDLETRTTTALTGPGPTRLFSGDPDVVWGPDGVRALVRGRGEFLEACHPAPSDAAGATARTISVRRTPGATYVGLSDEGRALLVDAKGVLACDVPRPGQIAFAPLERVLEWPAGLTCDDARPAPGRRLLVTAASGATHVVDLVTGGVVRLQHDEPFGPLRRAVTYSPDGRCALALRRSEALLFDLSTGERLGRAEAPRAAGSTDADHAPAWTPDGQAVALPWGDVLFLGEHAQGDAHCATVSPHAHAPLGGRQAAGFVLDRAVLRDAPLSLARPFSTEPPVVLVPSVDGGVR